MDPKTTTPTADAQPEWHEPFYEPQTIPAGWDVSAILPASDPKPKDEDANQAED
jgi:hypothetical protein